MYAIVKIKGKQYRVGNDDVIDVDLLDGDIGEQLEFNDVLFVHDGSSPVIGASAISSWLVKGELVGVSSGPKVYGMKYKPRHRDYRKWGHRQHYSRIKVSIAKASKK